MRATNAARMRRYIASLPEGYPITSGRLACALDLPRPTVSTYLRRLQAAGVVALHTATKPLQFRPVR